MRRQIILGWSIWSGKHLDVRSSSVLCRFLSCSDDLPQIISNLLQSFRPVGRSFAYSCFLWPSSLSLFCPTFAVLSLARCTTYAKKGTLTHFPDARGINVFISPAPNEDFLSSSGQKKEWNCCVVSVHRGWMQKSMNFPKFIGSQESRCSVASAIAVYVFNSYA